MKDTRFFGFLFSIIFMFLLEINTLYSQVGVRISYQKNSADMGYLLKSTMLTEVYYEGHSDIRFKYGASLGFAPLQTRLDTVSIGTFYMGDSNVLLPSWAIYANMKQYSLGFNMEYHFIEGRFNLVAGTDVYFHILEYDLEYYVPQDRHTYSDELVVTMGIVPRIGMRYNITEALVLQGGIGKSLAIDYQWNKFLYWKIYCGIHYYFNY